MAGIVVPNSNTPREYSSAGTSASTSAFSSRLDRLRLAGTVGAMIENSAEDSLSP